MRPLSATLALCASMGLSAVFLLMHTSCACFLNMCPEGEGLDESCCTNPAAPTYYTCQVELEGPDTTDWTLASFGRCFAGADEAHAQAPAIAQLDNPGKVADAASCQAVSCPGGGVDEVSEMPLPSNCLLIKDGGLGFGGGVL